MEMECLASRPDRFTTEERAWIPQPVQKLDHG